MFRPVTHPCAVPVLCSLTPCDRRDAPHRQWGNVTASPGRCCTLRRVIMRADILSKWTEQSVRFPVHLVIVAHSTRGPGSYGLNLAPIWSHLSPVIPVRHSSKSSPLSQIWRKPDQFAQVTTSPRFIVLNVTTSSTHLKKRRLLPVRSTAIRHAPLAPRYPRFTNSSISNECISSFTTRLRKRRRRRRRRMRSAESTANGSPARPPTFVGDLHQQGHKLAAGDHLGPARQPQLGISWKIALDRDAAADVWTGSRSRFPPPRSAILGRRSQSWCEALGW